MKNNFKILISIGILFLGFVFTFFGLKNMRSMKTSYFKISRENTSILAELENSKKNYDYLNQTLNNKKTRVENLNNELEKFDIISSKSSEIEDLNLKLQDSILFFQNNFFDNYFESHNKIKDEKSLNGIFINSDLDDISIKSNLAMLPYIINSPINYVLNQKIGRHNAKVYENLGILKYLENGDNYLIKSIILNDSSEISNLVEDKNKISLSVRDYYSVYKNIYKQSISSNKFIDSKNLNFNDINENEIKNNNEFNTLNAIAIEILNTSVNYLNDFNISKDGKETKLLNNEEVLMSEKSIDNKIITTYYNNIYGYDYNFIDEIN
ncbi:hypothetical protein KQI68_04160 [Peptoniphilus sp. MSJ-1]|uniref:Uncharacterized protein n=1 Tax=Peptoniphilus ovalis TaxID=2841503 RepID=A0ABS6FIH9_9FIRM|nr:hypothetical protein [Peptoniphilus ovalis]MBU5669031.1 hypothetical protein [Peptoniphilus ovalis]